MNYMVLQGGILSPLMIDSVLVLAQALNERVHFRVNEMGVLSYCPI